MKFSVLLPTRNRLDLLAYAVNTVIGQDYNDWEIIISDNFSDEDIAGYVQSLHEPRVKYFRTDSFIPVTDNWNKALDKCDGDYIIMLGDDDCLMKGYFSTLNRFIEQFESPDFVYTSAFLYAYPGVLPGIKDGFLRSYNKRNIFKSATEPFLLERNNAIGFVNDSLNFRVTFDYNMQFSLVSKKLVEKMKRYGSFYQSPYPDYYASNAMMLKAERILVVPQSLVTVGISPKSFGSYYFNDAEGDGNIFLNNLPDPAMVRRLQAVILPGTTMNTSWLIAMETLAVNFSAEFGVKVNYARYRLIQVCAVYTGLLMNNENAKMTYALLKGKIRFGEWLKYGLALLLITKMTPKRYYTRLSHRIQSSSGTHPGASMPTIKGKFDTIMDVFSRLDPNNYEELAEKADD